MIEPASRAPASFTAGTTVKFKLGFADFPADDGWTATYEVRGADGSITKTATADGSDHLFELTPTETAETPGRYAYQIVLSKGAEVYVPTHGDVRIDRNFADIVGNQDTRSQARIALEAINAVLAKKATRDQKRFKIDDRELERTPVTELLTLRSHYAALVARERNLDRKRRGLAPRDKVFVRFAK
ncbi:MAG: hypothetical protein MI806_26040 [Minwuiales bacterium]|nr:hypothetical protein [Minwuiales bacterium]